MGLGNMAEIGFCQNEVGQVLDLFGVLPGAEERNRCDCERMSGDWQRAVG
jgi:hypothetical protein